MFGTATSQFEKYGLGQACFSPVPMKLVLLLISGRHVSHAMILHPALRTGLYTLNPAGVLVIRDAMVSHDRIFKYKCEPTPCHIEPSRNATFLPITPHWVGHLNCHSRQALIDSIAS